MINLVEKPINYLNFVDIVKKKDFGPDVVKNWAPCKEKKK